MPTLAGTIRGLPAWIDQAMQQASSPEDLGQRLKGKGVPPSMISGYVQLWQARQDPRIAQAVQHAQQTGKAESVDLGNSNRIDIEPDGSVSGSFGSILKPLLAAGAVAGGGLLAGSLLGGGAASGAAGTAGAGGTLAATPTVGAVGGLAPGLASGTSASGLAAAAPVAATTASGGLGAWGPILGNAIGAGASIYGANKAASANEQAAALQAQSAKESLDFLKSVYGQRQQQLAPYLALSQGALPYVGGLLGIDLPKSSFAANVTANPTIPTGPWTPTPEQQGTPQTVQPGTIPGGAALFAGGAGRPDATFGGPAPVSATAGVKAMIAPDGTTKYVPGPLVTQALAAGARVVGG